MPRSSSDCRLPYDSYSLSYSYVRTSKDCKGVVSMANMVHRALLFFRRWPCKVIELKKLEAATTRNKEFELSIVSRLRV